MSEQATLTRKWSIDGFKAFWGNPDPALIPLVYEVATDDIVGHWPAPIGDVHGAGSYISVFEAILQVCPDLSLKALEHAQAGDSHFVHWVATGSGPNGRFEFNGIDRIRTQPDGRVYENYICSDGELFARVAAHMRGERT